MKGVQLIEGKVCVDHIHYVCGDSAKDECIKVYVTLEREECAYVL